MRPEHIEELQGTVGYLHVPSLWQVPPHTVPLPLQSVSPQQLFMGMHVVPLVVVHSLKPEAQVVQSPTPVQVKFPPHGAVAPGMQVPPLQVPAPTRLAPAQPALLQLLVVG